MERKVEPSAAATELQERLDEITLEAGDPASGWFGDESEELRKKLAEAIQRALDAAAAEAIERAQNRLADERVVAVAQWRETGDAPGVREWGVVEGLDRAIRALAPRQTEQPDHHEYSPRPTNPWACKWCGQDPAVHLRAEEK